MDLSFYSTNQKFDDILISFYMLTLLLLSMAFHIGDTEASKVRKANVKDGRKAQGKVKGGEIV